MWQGVAKKPWNPQLFKQKLEYLHKHCTCTSKKLNYGKEKTLQEMLLTPCCQPWGPKTTMSTNFERPRSAINVGSSTTCSRCFRASGTNFAVVQGSCCCFRAEVAIAKTQKKPKLLLGRSRSSQMRGWSKRKNPKLLLVRRRSSQMRGWSEGKKP